MLDEFKNVMKQEDKELLLDDLCARLPYGVMLSITHDKYTDETFNARISTIDYCGEIKVRYGFEEYEQVYSLEQIKPYLFPLSSMTEEIIDEIYNNAGVYDIGIDSSVHIEVGTKFEDLTKIFHILHKHHIDYRGLIPKGLANDATNKNIY